MAANSTTSSPCAHCGLPVSPPPAEDSQPGFCCNGCRSVYEALHEYGLEGFYELRAERPEEPAAAATPGFAEMDTPEFQQRFAQPLPGGLTQVSLHVEGLHCAACVWVLEKLAAITPGIESLRVDIGRKRLTARVNLAEIRLSELATRVARLGYRPHPLREDAAEKAARQEERTLWIAIGVSGAAAGNIMLLAIALYSGDAQGIDAEHRQFFRWTSMAIAALAVAIGGRLFFRGAIAGLRAGVLHMDLPISLGILAGFVGGSINTIRDQGEVYFDSVAALIFLLLVGRFLQQRQQRQAASAVAILGALCSGTARRLVGDDERQVPIEALQPGALVRVLESEQLPADGIVRSGRAALDVAWLTGESRPVAANQGSLVYGGTRVLSGELIIEVEHAGAGSRAGKLAALVEECSQRPSRIVRSADRIAGWFVATVLALTVVTAVTWYRAAPERLLDQVMAMLVVTCPCALGLATPLAMAAALRRASAKGLLIRSGDACESLARPGTLWLDKTGTLTMGFPMLVDWWGDECAQDYLGALEARSHHPLAGAIRKRFPAGSLQAKDVSETPGQGLVGWVEGYKVAAGSPSAIEAVVGALPLVFADKVLQIVEGGLTPMVVAIEDQPVAVAGFHDALRPESAELVAQLAAQGWRVGLLSGDTPDVASAVASELGIPPERVVGGASPEEKVRVIEASLAARTDSRQPVVMVGDGINDAAALAAATVGVAVSGGAEAALRSADVYLSSPGLEPLAQLLTGSRRTLSIVRGNLFLSLLYNSLGASLVLAGLVGPLVAAILMPISSLTVVATSFRRRSF